MFKNYLKTASRYLLKNKGYTFINVFGLSIGLAAFILLSLFVKVEFSYDEHLSQKDLIYQVYLKDTTNKTPRFAMQTMAPVGPLMVEQVPEIVESTRFGSMSKKVLKMNNQRFLTDGLRYTDPETLNFFDLTPAEGSGSLRLEKSDIILAESEAIKVYGSVRSAIGQTIEIVGLKSFQVAGIFKDLPDNTHVSFKYLISFENANDAFFSGINFVMQKTIFDWGVVSAFPLYVKLNSADLDLEAIEQKMNEALQPHQENHVAKLLPVTEVYFSELNRGYFGKKGEKDKVQLYLIIAIVILSVAIINYMNLATARYSKRSREVGIRKTVGGHKMQLARQFLTESFVITFVGLILAICIVEICSPALSNFVGKSIGIDYSTYQTYLVLILIVVLVSFLAGIYPASFLSRFNAIEVLSGRATGGKKGSKFRTALVGFQVFICLGLISVTMIVLQQFKYMSNLDLGFDHDQIVGVSMADKGIAENYETFKNELLKNASIESVTGASFSVFDGSASFFMTPEGMEEDVPITFMNVERNFVQQLGITIDDGSDFPKEGELNTREILINRTAQEKFGWDSSIGKTIGEYKVLGQVEDFIYGSARETIKPLMIVPSKSGFTYAYVKISGGNVRAAMDHLQATFESMASDYPFDYNFLDDVFAKKYEQEEKLSRVFSTFTILAIIVAGLGILGLSIFIAESRIKEVGIRKILGANIGQLIWLLNSGITKLILLVALITLPLVYHFMSEWLDGFVYNISISVFTMLTPLIALIAVVWTILIFQSLKSANANPVNALRTE
ncbi:ABC transporter permease [Roseivirga sp. UBA838]|uniref:ABC transporter permease n=1 Tax=Roseivirga sp. UBA838 TaxID=1947393 RepID=UPI00257DB6EF|nr:ABC transporter permease [Roseivirga sp. UBA838]|tara:strand:+ start:7152 stop:9515 length:2364 start_codon:yes stop_codon:yes gene_type:complete